MDTPTKQRLVGAAVLVALAVIFLPMLVEGPAPDSGVSDVPLQMPRQPDDIETRELPLVVPQAGEGGALGPAPVQGEAAGERLPTVDTAHAAAPDDAADPASMQPASIAGGDYAVHFGAYASRADADTVVGQLRSSQLPGYSEQAALDGRPVWRVRIGPFATRAQAEAARLRAAHVRDDVKARVIVLDADDAAAGASQPVASAQAPLVEAEPLPPEPSAAATASEPAPAEPASATPAAAASAPGSQPAAAGTGFAVQVGAFGNAAQAAKLRDRLRAAGFTAFTETVQSDKGPLTRVRVGPVLGRAEADRLRAQLRAQAGVSGIVRPHP